MCWTGVAGLVLLGLGLGVTHLIEDLFARSESLGILGIAFTAAAALALGVVTLRELTALVQEYCFYHLEAPIVRVTGWDTPYPHIFEWEYFPGPQRVADGMRRALEG